MRQTPLRMRLAAWRLGAKQNTHLDNKTEKGIGDMKNATQNNDNSTELDAKRTAERDEGAMSPSMRELILSFGRSGSEPTWNPDAYTGRSKQAQ